MTTDSLHWAQTIKVVCLLSHSTGWTLEVVGTGVPTKLSLPSPSSPHQMAGHWYPPLCPHLFNYYSALWLGGSPIARGTHKQQHAHEETTVATTTQRRTTVWISPTWLICTTVGENLCGQWPTVHNIQTYVCHHHDHQDHHDQQCTMHRYTTQGSSAQQLLRTETTLLGLQCPKPQYLNYMLVPLSLTTTFAKWQNCKKKLLQWQLVW